MRKLISVFSVTAIVLIVFIAVFMSARSAGNVTFSNITDGFRQVFFSEHTSGYPYTNKDLTFREIKAIGDSVLLLNADSAYVMTPSAKITARIALDSADTKVKTCNGRALIYENSKNSVVLTGKTEKLTQVSLQDEILTAVIGKSGAFAVALKDEEACSKVIVYDRSSNEIFGWKFANERISDMAFSSNGKKLAVTVCSAKNAVIYSRIVVFDIAKNEMLEDIRFDGCMMLRVCYTSRGRLVAVGDSQYVIYNKDFQRVDGLEYSENTLSSVSIDDNGNTVLAFTQNGTSKLSVVRHNASGKKTFSVVLEGTDAKLYADGPKTAVVCGEKVTVLNSSGETVEEITLDSTPDSLAYSSGDIFTLETGAVKKY
ncbi:MAG: hypothetical protein IJC37_06290 [Clostridia bacterium]|nr:hypothetical protein [Clostridia bacterium]